MLAALINNEHETYQNTDWYIFNENDDMKMYH